MSALTVCLKDTWERYCFVPKEAAQLTTPGDRDVYLIKLMPWGVGGGSAYGGYLEQSAPARANLD